jgi:hypothetical protein
MPGPVQKTDAKPKSLDRVGKQNPGEPKSRNNGKTVGGYTSAKRTIRASTRS